MRFGTATRRPFTRRPGNASPLAAIRYRTEPEEAPITDPLGREPDLARLEAMLFMADEPLTARRLAESAGLADAARARELIDRLKTLLEADGSAFQVEEIAGGY